MTDPAPFWLGLEVSLERLPGVHYPCLVCGGRGAAATGHDCTACANTGEQPAGPARDGAYPNGGIR